jgi:predicted ATPase
VCTAALAIYLGYPFSPFLASELERVKKEAIYQNRVLFIRNLGFITPSDARRISFEETTGFNRARKSGGASQHNQGRNRLAMRVRINPRRFRQLHF